MRGFHKHLGEVCGARLFHLVSLSLHNSLVDLPGLVPLACVWVLLVLLCFLFFVGFFLLEKFDFYVIQIPVVDRPCLALVRQCRKMFFGCFDMCWKVQI